MPALSPADQAGKWWIEGVAPKDDGRLAAAIAIRDAEVVADYIASVEALNAHADAALANYIYAASLPPPAPVMAEAEEEHPPMRVRDLPPALRDSIVEAFNDR